MQHTNGVPVPTVPAANTYQFYWCSHPNTTPSTKHKRLCQRNEIPTPANGLTEQQAQSATSTQGPLCAACQKPMITICAVIVFCHKCNKPQEVHFFEANNPFTHHERVQSFTTRYATQALTATEPCPDCNTIDLRVRTIVTTHRTVAGHLTWVPDQDPETKNQATSNVHTDCCVAYQCTIASDVNGEAMCWCPPETDDVCKWAQPGKALATKDMPK